LLPTFDVEFQNAKQFITLQEYPKQCASTNESLHKILLHKKTTKCEREKKTQQGDSKASYEIRKKENHIHINNFNKKLMLEPSQPTSRVKKNSTKVNVNYKKNPQCNLKVQSL
jgi:hypothetical protein